MNFYEKDYYLRTTDFNFNNYLHPSAILEMFQDAAGEHATKLGVGFSDLLERNLMWVVMRIKFEVLKMPKILSTVRVKTWPLAPQRAIFQRDYEVYDKGELIIRGTSEWVVLDKITHKMIPAQGIYPEMEYLTNRTFDTKLIKFAEPQDADIYGKVTAEYTDIDPNGHVNNTKYANYVMNILKKAEPIEIFQIYYKREVKCGEELDIYIKNTEDGYTVKALENGEAMFSCKMKFKE